MIHNSFYGYGQVAAAPRVYKNSEGKFAQAIVPVATIRGRRDAGNNLDKVRYDCPTIRTRKEEQVREINSWKENDMVLVKGTVTSREVVRKRECPCCKNINESQGIITFINPIYCSKIEDNIQHSYGVSLLRERNEISNNVTLSGMLTCDPLYYKSESGVETTQYQICVFRKFRIMEDDPERKVDFIWVRSFGKIARKDAEDLKKGMRVLLDGYLQTRSYEKVNVCDSCGEKFLSDENSMEIVPYAVEYFRGSLEQEDIVEMDEAELLKADEAASGSVLNNL